MQSNKKVACFDLHDGASLYWLDEALSKSAIRLVDSPVGEMKARICSFSAGTKGVLLDPIVSGVGLNGVVVSKRVPLRSGDRIFYGDSSILLVPSPRAVMLPERVAEIDELMTGLHSEFHHNPGREIVVLSLQTQTLNVSSRVAAVQKVSQILVSLGVLPSWGHLARDISLAVLGAVPAAVQSQCLLAARSVVSDKVQLDVHLESENAERLILKIWKSVFNHELDLDFSVWSSATMLQLSSLLQELPLEHSVAFIGEPGSGRERLAKELLELRGESGSRERLLKASSRIALLSQYSGEPAIDAIIPVPPLRSRIADVDELANQYLLLARTVLNRSKLSLSLQVKNAFRAWPWPGNVTELKNVIFRAARMTASDEIGLDALPKRMLLEAPTKNLRNAVQEAEREVLLNMLARTKWNVSVAATRLGLPRRTVVYRMARLGLKRPAK